VFLDNLSEALSISYSASEDKTLHQPLTGEGMLNRTGAVFPIKKGDPGMKSPFTVLLHEQLLRSKSYRVAVQ
jgi:hypothetical protein